MLSFFSGLVVSRKDSERITTLKESAHWITCRFDGFFLPTAWDRSCWQLWAWLQRLTISINTATVFVTGDRGWVEFSRDQKRHAPLMYKSFCNIFFTFCNIRYSSNVVFLEVIFFECFNQTDLIPHWLP